MQAQLVTPELKAAVEAFLLLHAYAETIRPVVEGYQREIVAQLRPQIAQVWVDMCAEQAGVITEPKEMYLAEDQVAEEYFERLTAAHAAHGFTVPDGCCPLLIAEEQVRKAKRRVIEESQYLSGLSLDVALGSLEIFEQLVELTVALVLSVTDISRESVLAGV